MKHVETGGKEVCIANVSGKFYAIGDRCPHMNASLSMGILEGTIITCPLHFSRFDVTTGKKIAGQVEAKMEGMDKLRRRCWRTQRGLARSRRRSRRTIRRYSRSRFLARRFLSTSEISAKQVRFINRCERVFVQNRRGYFFKNHYPLSGYPGKNTKPPQATSTHSHAMPAGSQGT